MVPTGACRRSSSAESGRNFGLLRNKQHHAADNAPLLRRSNRERRHQTPERQDLSTQLQGFATAQSLKIAPLYLPLSRMFAPLLLPSRTRHHGCLHVAHATGASKHAAASIFAHDVARD